MVPANVSDNVRRALHFALTNIRVRDNPVGSNRGREIDAWARELGAALGSFWCPLAVAMARKEGGLWIPSHHAGNCNEWMCQACDVGLFSERPVPGAAVLYTNFQTLLTGPYFGLLDTVHIGLVLRVNPVLLSIEGKTTLGKYDRRGWVQTLRKVDRSRVIGFVLPELADEGGAC